MNEDKSLIGLPCAVDGDHGAELIVGVYEGRLGPHTILVSGKKFEFDSVGDLCVENGKVIVFDAWEVK